MCRSTTQDQAADRVGVTLGSYCWFTSAAVAGVARLGCTRLGRERHEPLLKLCVISVTVFAVVHAPVAVGAQGDDVVGVVGSTVRNTGGVVWFEVGVSFAVKEGGRATAPLAASACSATHEDLQGDAAAVDASALFRGISCLCGRCIVEKGRQVGDGHAPTRIGRRFVVFRGWCRSDSVVSWRESEDDGPPGMARLVGCVLDLVEARVDKSTPVAQLGSVLQEQVQRLAIGEVIADGTVAPVCSS